MSVIWLRVAEEQVRIQLEAADHFFQHAEFSFARELKKLDTEFKRYSKSYWNKQLDFGSTRGDLLGEEFHAFKDMQQMNRYFGVLLVYSVLERFLYSIFRDAKRLDLIKDQKIAKKPFLDFKGYKQVLKKDLHVDLGANQKTYPELIKLLRIRNAIAHYGGRIQRENANQLKQYGYNRHEQIELDDEYFSASRELVNDTCLLIAKGYEIFLKKHNHIGCS